MDFLNPHKKRAHYIRLMIGYVLVAIALAMGTLILVLLSYGYDLDRKTGNVIQNGLVYISAQPGAADVYLNGVRQGKTNTKLALPGGQYGITLEREGYRNWSRKFSLQGGSVERMDYPLLFPTKLASKDVELYSEMPSFASQSPDHHWLITQEPGQLVKFDLMDLTKDNTPTNLITLSANLLTASTDINQTWHLVDWAGDNRHLLLRHHFANRDEFIMVDRQTPANSFNINQLFGITPSQVALRDKRFDQLYIYDKANKSLQIGDVKAVNLTALLSHVLAFKPHDDKTVLYVSDDNTAAGQVALKLYSAGKIYKLRQLPVNANYLLAVAHFDNHWYMAAGVASENRAYVYRDPENILKQQPTNTGLLPAIVLNISKPTFLSASDSERFIAAQSGSQFAVYDTESDRRYYYDISPTIAAGQAATWLDGNHLSVVSGNKAVVFDFDGINKQTLVTANPNFRLMFSPDFKWLYAFGPSITVPGRAAITRTDLIVK